jgi:hypothetical protein
MDTYDFSSKLRIAAEDLEQASYAKTSDNKIARRIIIANPSLEDVVGPTDIFLSSVNVLESSSVGTTIANITAQNGLGPFTYTITDDPDAKFRINGNNLELDAPVDFQNANQHNVTITVQDANNKTFIKTFLINVLEAIETLNKKVTFNGIDEAIFNNQILELNGVMNRAFTICFSVTRYREGVFEKVISRQATSVNKRGFAIEFDTTDRLHFKIITAENNNDLLDVRFSSTHGLNTKKFYAITYDGSQVASGVNGRINGGSGARSIISDTHNFDQNTGSNECYFGATSNLNDLLQGDLSDIMIFSRVLENSEISEIYNAGDILVNLNGTAAFDNNVMHVPVTSNDVYPTLTDLRGNYDLTMNANMSQGNIVEL